MSPEAYSQDLFLAPTARELRLMQSAAILVAGISIEVLPATTAEEVKAAVAAYRQVAINLNDRDGQERYPPAAWAAVARNLLSGHEGGGIVRLIEDEAPSGGLPSHHPYWQELGKLRAQAASTTA